VIRDLRDFFRVLNSPCREYAALFSRQLDEPLPRGVALAMRVHVLYCRGCARFRAQVRRLRDLASTIGQDPAADQSFPRDARQRVLNRVSRGPTKN
jgi:hypothetical protein